MQRSQRKRCAPSWLIRKPSIKIRFTQDGVTDKVTESWKIKLEENGKALDGALSNFSFRVGQVVWCYWKTANEEDRKYFEAKVTEVWADSVVVEDQSLQSRCFYLVWITIAASPLTIAASLRKKNPLAPRVKQTRSWMMT